MGLLNESFTNTNGNTQMSYGSFFKDSLEVNKEYSLLTEPTRIGAKYIITVRGEYSQWGNTTPRGKGNDAVWYNEVPIYGIPMVDNILKEIFKDPIWFGDSTLYTIPIVNEQFTMIDFLGFRLNGDPLPAFDRDTSSHTYKVEMLGNGDPITFELWDYAYDIETSKKESKYSDNRGMLYINVKEISENTEKNCGYKIIQNNEAKTKVLLRAKIDEQLKSTIYYNGIQVETIDLICSDSLNINTRNYYLIDNSFSMYNPISTKDLTPKIDLLKYMDQAIFSNGSNYFVFNQDTIKEINLNNISSLAPKGNTELYSSLIQMINLAEESSNIILITDSFSGDDKKTKQMLLNLIEDRQDLSFYSLVLVNDENKKDQNSINELMQIASQFSFFQVSTINSKDNYINSLLSFQSVIFNDNCCTAIIEIDKCRTTEQTATTTRWNNGTNDYYFQIPCEELGYSQNSVPKRIINHDNIELKGKLIYDIYGNQLSVSSAIELNNGIYLIQDINSKYHEIINIRR